jgi:hypothetical protein
VIVTAAAGAALLVFGATAARAGGNGNSPIRLALVHPITITKLADLQFGRLSSGAAGGTAIVSAAGARSVTGDVTEEGGTVSAASFEVGGHQLLDYDITLPTSIVISSGANTMVVNNFTTDKPGNVGDIPPGRTDTFSVGATLNAGAGQAAGAYTGTFDVTVSYQ